MTKEGFRRPNGTPSSELRIKQGRIFTIRQNWNGIADGTARNVVVDNPADSGVSMLTISPNFASSAESFAEKITNPAIDTSGTSITPRNKNLGASRTTNVSAETGGTYSGGTSRGQEVVGSSAESGGGGGAIGVSDFALEIPPGNTVQYRIESDASSNDMSIALSWVEEPE